VPLDGAEGRPVQRAATLANLITRSPRPAACSVGVGRAAAGEVVAHVRIDLFVLQIRCSGQGERGGETGRGAHHDHIAQFDARHGERGSPMQVSPATGPTFVRATVLLKNFAELIAPFAMPAVPTAPATI
jgi:hypothetical protein